MTNNALPHTSLPSVTVQSINDQFRLTCSELGITCTAPTIEAGYATLMELAAGADRNETWSQESTISAERKPARSALAKHSQVIQGHAPSSLLTPIILVILLTPVVLISLSILNDIRSVSSSLHQLMTSTASTSNNLPHLSQSSRQHLTRLADTIEKLTPERQEELRNNLERISIKLAPIVQGLRPLFEAAGLAPSMADHPSATPERSAPTSRLSDGETE